MFLSIIIYLCLFYSFWGFFTSLHVWGQIPILVTGHGCLGFCLPAMLGVSCSWGWALGWPLYGCNEDCSSAPLFLYLVQAWDSLVRRHELFAGPCFRTLREGWGGGHRHG